MNALSRPGRQAWLMRPSQLTNSGVAPTCSQFFTRKTHPSVTAREIAISVPTALLDLVQLTYAGADFRGSARTLPGRPEPT